MLSIRTSIESNYADLQILVRYKLFVEEQQQKAITVVLFI